MKCNTCFQRIGARKNKITLKAPVQNGKVWERERKKPSNHENSLDCELTGKGLRPENQRREKKKKKKWRKTEIVDQTWEIRRTKQQTSGKQHHIVIFIFGAFLGVMIGVKITSKNTVRKRKRDIFLLYIE